MRHIFIARETHIHNRIPVITAPRQQHHSLHVAYKENETVLDLHWGDQLRLSLAEVDNFGEIEHERYPVILISAENIHGAALNQSDDLWGDSDASNLRKPFKMP